MPFVFLSPHPHPLSPVEWGVMGTSGDKDYLKGRFPVETWNKLTGNRVETLSALGAVGRSLSHCPRAPRPLSLSELSTMNVLCYFVQKKDGKYGLRTEHKSQEYANNN